MEAPHHNPDPAAYTLYWKVDDPAPEEETKDFWNRLRNFYRTGEKNTDEQAPPVSSALLHLLDEGAPNYPFSPRGLEEVSIDLGENIFFETLHHLLVAYQKDKRHTFQTQLSDLKIGLHALFKSEDKTRRAGELKQTFDFAEGMIAFDKMVELVSSRPKKMPEDRLRRLQTVVEQLQSGLAHYSQQSATVVVEVPLSLLAYQSQLTASVALIKAEEDAFDQIQKLFASQMAFFLSLIRAYRIAKLEIEGDYDPEIQDAYFDHFNRHRLSEDELSLFPPLALVVSHQYVLEHLAAFSSLLAANLPVNIFVLNDAHISSADPRVSWEDASRQFRQELAALTIAHRHVYTFQAGWHDPNDLYEGLAACLHSTAPGVCHLSMTLGNTGTWETSPLAARAAQAGRYFPTIKYDPKDLNNWGGRFDLSANLQTQHAWPQLTLTANTSSDTEAIIEIAFTYADYKAIYPEKAQELMLIPSGYYTEYLLPLSDYLNCDEKQLYGKIPYIWVVDEKRQLHRAAVPNVWVVSCQERLDFWCFLQELGGINNYHVNEALAQQKAALTLAHEEEKIKLEAAQQDQIAQVREASLLQATQRLVAVLLDLGGNDQGIASLMKPREEIQPLVTTPVQSNGQATAPDVQSATTMQPESTAPVAWVDSDNCTSCNDCTDKYAHLFAYNEDQRAYLKDATKGTYEQLVKAAENCPAACIHPGLPLNKEEKNLEKLMLRAAKFN